MHFFKRNIVFKNSNDEKFTMSPAYLLLYLITSLLTIEHMSILLYINNNLLHKFSWRKQEYYIFICFSGDHKNEGLWVWKDGRLLWAAGLWLEEVFWACSTINVCIWQHIKIASILSLQREVQGTMQLLVITGKTLRVLLFFFAVKQSVSLS